MVSGMVDGRSAGIGFVTGTINSVFTGVLGSFIRAIQSARRAADIEKLRDRGHELGRRERTGPIERALIEMWNRRMEFEVLSMAAGSFRNTSDFFKGRIPQVKEYGEICKNAAVKRLEWLDTVLADREFIAGPRYTIADITALIGIDFGRTTQIRIQENQKNLARWHQAVSSRPSAKA